ncbi:glycoside hydrolase family 2 TIM barrel-domain containing protein [Planobispora longispora]|uniref:Beta-galactosidase n=1 Tax=Planobispora longispora TaxID=28887 RepID=A0A8J3W392_9ACTN|nr:glycoside hydrolase family 2 TIM barrel-domain containing protein [Planobispora longispora]BFE78065.1 glycoside hydrolase family 2 TIM barrel-domain containing protein [Planobispora longispora]GIH73591.1 beta-galactosidase [Planobispora longispora]
MNRLPMHSLRRAPEVDLDGTWEFRLLPYQEEWKSVQVPDLWTMREKDDPPHYLNVAMPFEEVPPTVPAHNPTGQYRRTVELAAQPGRRTILHVGAAEGHLNVIVNDQAVGDSTDSHLAAEFDITEAVTSGVNTIELTVAKWSAATYLEDQDHWWQSGLSRSVFLYTVPEVRLGDVAVVTDYADGRGSLNVTVSTIGLDHLHEVGWSARIGVLGRTESRLIAPRVVEPAFPDSTVDRSTRPEPVGIPDGVMNLLSLHAAGAPIVGELRPIADIMTVRPGKAGSAVFALDVLDVAPWTAETPHLEDLLVELVSPEGEVADAANFRIGFRRVRIEGRDLLVNGERVLIQGVNRHDVNPRTGRVITRDQMLAELSLLKRFNVNAIRTSHYPNDPVFLDLCDEIGFYVVDEADIEGHAFTTTLAHDPRYLSEFVERVSRMVLRDRNHPSVIIWSLGNETGYGPNHDAAAAWVRRVDPGRPLHYEGAIAHDWHGGHAASDLVCPMYPSFEALTAFSADPRADRPVILCEYAYSQGNSTGGLAHYWELFESLPGLQGGFIWEFKDHALDPDGDGRYRYGGDFGDEPNDGTTLLNGVVFTDLTPKPALYEARGLFSPIRVSMDGGRLRIRNRQSFADLSAYDLNLRVETEAGPVGALTLPAPRVAAGEEVTIDLPGSIVALLGTALALTVSLRTREDALWAPAGTEIAAHQITFPRPLPQLPRASTGGEVRHPLLRRVPRLCLWRALTDNDGSFMLDHRFVRSGFFRITPVDVDGAITRYATAYGDEVVHTRTVTRVGEGDYVLDEHVVLPSGEALRVGMEFELADGFDHARWVGLGPWENYPDRRSSALLGAWENRIDDLSVPYLKPQENGGRGEVTELVLSGPAGTVRTTHATPLHMTVSRHTIEELETATHWWELPPSARTVVHLDIAQRGVGTAMLGPDTRPAYRLTEREYAWQWRLTLTSP